MLTADSPGVWATCRVCRSRFAYSESYYAEKGLLAPKTCRACLAARRARCVTVRAVVRVVTERYIFAEGEGRTFFVSPAGLGPDMPELVEGDCLVLQYDPEEPVPSGRRPRALRARLAGARP